MNFFAPRKSNEELAKEKVMDDSSTGFLAEVWDWMKSIVIALFIVILIHQYGFHLSTVKGSSMKPTLEEGEWLFINKAARFTGPPQRGDVIVVKEPEGIETDHPYLVKRVVAIAGDEVTIRQGKLFINGDEIQEAYTDSLIEDGRFDPYTVQQGCLFVMGDNRHRLASYDSRSFGAVSVEQVEGRADLIVWPLKNFREL
ncbi:MULTISPECIES: signal peptidase I [unclassified Paenibacillus]|uniref:signal peptidase I n=1 Tax=unclassified Paenibacillus TaxID=185978 RepID=UPI00363B1E86